MILIATDQIRTNYAQSMFSCSCRARDLCQCLLACLSGGRLFFFLMVRGEGGDFRRFPSILRSPSLPLLRRPLFPPLFRLTLFTFLHDFRRKPRSKLHPLGGESGRRAEKSENYADTRRDDARGLEENQPNRQFTFARSPPRVISTENCTAKTYHFQRCFVTIE